MRPLDPRLLRHARAARGYLVLTTVLGMSTAALVIVQALLLARVIAGVAMDGEDLADVQNSLLGIIAVVAARAAVAWAQDRYGHRAATTVIAQLRGLLAGHVAALGPAATEGDQGAALATLTTRGLDALDGYLVRYLPQLFLTATVTPAVLVVIWWQDMLSGIAVLVTLPLVPFFMILVGWATQATADRRLRTMQRLGAQVLDLVAGLPTLRALGRDRGQARRVREVGDAYRRATMGTLRAAFLSALVLESLTTLSVAIVAVSIGMRLLDGGLTLYTGLAALILAPEAYLPLRMLGQHFHASVDGLAAASEAFAVLERPAPEPGTRPAPDLRETVLRLDGVSVLHPGRDRATPAGLDLDVRPGDVLALAGPSGIGKSSAVLVLLGLRRPEHGQVQLIPMSASPSPDTPAGADGAPGTDRDGPPGTATDLIDIEPASWFAQLAWAPQRPLLVPGTLAENVRLVDRPDDRDLTDVARLSGLDQVVRELPDGWDTVIGQGGHGLSAGQRQRLALARAFLRPAQLVVLDEPTAHLDPATEQVVYAAIERLREEGRTVVLVAHRPSLLALADRVVEVQDGPLPDAADGDGTDPGAGTEPDGDTGTEPEPLTTTTGTVTA